MKRKVDYLLTLAILALGAPVIAAETDSEAKKAKADDVQSVELFKAIDDGLVDVEFVPKDATQATVVFKNKTDKPLDLNLPAAFGALDQRAVLGQFGGMGGMGGMGGGMGGMGGGGMGGMGGGGMGMGGGGQGMGGGFGGGMGGGMGGMGGGMGGMGGGMGGMGGGMGGMFRVEPDKTRRVKVQTMCLEHGKPDPNPRMKYKIVPIAKVNKDPRVSQLCSLLANGKVPQNTAQAAAWHIANGLSWQELAHKNRVESKYTGNVRFFNQFELKNAFRVSSMIQAEYEKYVSTKADSARSEDYTEEEVSEEAVATES